MIATLILASSYITAPTTADAVNFVHGYSKDQKSTYDLTIVGEETGFEVEGSFELLIKSALEKGKMKASFTFLRLEMQGMDMAENMPPYDFELDKHGVPQKSEEDDAAIMAFVAMLSTYLPGDSLDEGGSYKIKLPKEAFEYSGTGKFTGMKEKGGMKLAVLKSEGTVYVMGEESPIDITTYYDPATKRVVFADAEVETIEDIFVLELKLKLKK